MSLPIIAVLAYFSILFPNGVITAIPSLSPASTTNEVGGKLGLGTGSQPIISLDTLEDAKENLIEDITRPLTNPLGALNPVSTPIIGNAGLPSPPPGPVPNRPGIFGNPTNSLGVIANSGAAIGLSALKINSILLAPLVGLGAKLSAPIIKIKSKVAAPFVFKGALLAKPFLKTGAALVAPTVKLARITTDQFQEFTQPLEEGIAEALRPLTDAARPFTNAVRPIPEAANLALGNENILEEQIQNVDLNTELGNINREVEVITEEVGNAFNRANVFNSQLNTQFNSLVNNEFSSQLNSELNVQVRSARNRRSANMYQEYPLFNEDYSNTIVEVQDYGNDNSQFGDNFQGQTSQSFESAESTAQNVHNVHGFTEMDNEAIVEVDNSGQEATTELESEVESVETDSSVQESSSQENIEEAESSNSDINIVESEDLVTMGSSLTLTEGSIMETSGQSESTIVALEDEESLIDMVATNTEEQKNSQVKETANPRETSNSKSASLSSSIGLSISTSGSASKSISSSVSSQKSTSQSSSSSSNTSQDNGIILVSESHGIPESEVDGTAMLTEEASLVVDGANNPFLCFRLKDVSNPSILNIPSK